MQETTLAETSSAVKKALQNAINDRCDCEFQFEAIYDGEFSCKTMVEHALYRGSVNGTSDRHTATELLAFIQDWIMNEGFFRVNQIRRWVSQTCSPLRIEHFNQPECSDETTTPTDGTTTAPTDGTTTAPTDGTTAPTDGTTAPTDGTTTAPTDGTTTTPTDGTTTTHTSGNGGDRAGGSYLGGYFSIAPI